jgi:hypothetical protein
MVKRLEKGLLYHISVVNDSSFFISRTLRGCILHVQLNVRVRRIIFLTFWRQK